MSIVSIFSGIYCNDTSLIAHLQQNLDLTLITDQDVVALGTQLSGIPESKLVEAFSSKTSVFNNFTHEKESSIAYLRLALAMMLEQKNIIFSGYSSLLLPQSIQPALRICLLARDEYRNRVAKETEKLTDQKIDSLLKTDDQNKSSWTQLLFANPDPWSSDLYDMVISMDQTQISEASAQIIEWLTKSTAVSGPNNMGAIEDFLLAAKAEVTFANAGHNVGVIVHQKMLTLNINHQVLMLSRLEEELLSIARDLPDIISTQIQVGKAGKSLYRKHNSQLPSKVLLVDDEKEFVQTLSERLQMREMGSVVAYDGPSALELVKNDDPEVMIIDLKMPGMDGMEILTKVKQTRPEIEIIVLTGHGSEQDRQKCMELGAFAYMQKPVDINLLSDSLNQAHNKIKAEQQLL